MPDTEEYNQMIDGININNETIWSVQCLRNIRYEDKSWYGTGLDHPSFVLFLDERSAIDYFIGRFPGTHGIRYTSSHRYEYIDLAAASRKIMLDGIMAKITLAAPKETPLEGME